MHKSTSATDNPTSPAEVTFNLHQGDCLQVLRTMPDCSVDSIVTDPPYGLGKAPDALAMLQDWMQDGHHDVSGAGFMGKQWDSFVPQPTVWRECMRVLKPGGHLLAFGGSRTYDLVVLGLRIAGFEIRDCIMWLYGSGFPKSLDVSKAVDGLVMFGGSNTRQLKMVNEQRPGDGRVRASTSNNGIVGTVGDGQKVTRDEPASEKARQWQGWGTALKPAHEPIVVARKPLDGTVAANVLAHGTGGLNIDGCRVLVDGEDRAPITGKGGIPARNDDATPRAEGEVAQPNPLGRWPANVVHDGSDEVVAAFPQAAGQLADESRSAPSAKSSFVYGAMKRQGEPSQDSENYGGVGFKMKPGARRLDAGSAARFFYCAKASRADRDDGCDQLEAKPFGMSSAAAAAAARGEHYDNGDGGVNRVTMRQNTHPTVKPTDLMRYLCRLVTPPGGLVLDPFMGSGSTGRGAVLEGFRFLGIELDPDYVKIAEARILAAYKAELKRQADAYTPQTSLF